MFNFELETISPPIENPIAGGGGINIWDKRNYVITYNPASRTVFSLKKSVGFVNTRGDFREKKVEEVINLSAEAYKLLDIPALLKAESNKEKEDIVKKAFKAAKPQTDAVAVEIA